VATCQQASELGYFARFGTTESAIAFEEGVEDMRNQSCDVDGFAVHLRMQLCVSVEIALQLDV
jgi:hypothetical protein